MTRADLKGTVSIQVLDRNGKIRHQHFGSNQILSVGVDYILDIVAGSGFTGGLIQYEIAFGDDGAASTPDMTGIQGTEYGVIRTLLSVGSTPLNFTQFNTCQFYNFSSAPGYSVGSVLIGANEVDVSNYYWNMMCRGRATDYLDVSSGFISEAVLFFHMNDGVAGRRALARVSFPRFEIFQGNDLRFNWYLEFGNSPANWVEQFEAEAYNFVD